MYKQLIAIYNTLFDSIKYLNLISANEYTNKFFPNAPGPMNLSNIFLNAFTLSNKIPQNITEYMENYYDIKLSDGPNNHIMVKQKIIRDFIPVYTNRDWNYFIGSGGSNKHESMIGYMMLMKYNYNHNDLFPKPEYGLVSQHKRYLKDAVTVDVNPVTFKGNKYIGNIGMKATDGIFPSGIRPYERNREDAVIGSIGASLDDFYGILKTHMIEEIIKEFHGTPSLAPTQKHNMIKQQLLDNIKGLNVVDQYSIDELLYTTLGQSLDELLINNFKYYIEQSSTKMVNNLVKQFKGVNLPQIDVYIPNNDYGFKGNFNKLQENLIQLYIDNKNNFTYDALKFANKQVGDEKKENQHIVSYFNYTTSDKILNMCYKMDLSIIQLLYNYGANMNALDATNSTPLYYALYLGYPELIKMLLDNGASINKKITNKHSLSPLKFITQTQSNHVDHFISFINPKTMFEKFYKHSYTTIINGLQSKPEFGNNLILGLENMFPQMLLMYNHQLYIYMSNYINYWGLQNFDSLCKTFVELNILGQNDCYSKNIPLLSVINKISNGDSIGTLNNKGYDLERKKQSLTELLNANNNKINNLNAELRRHTDINIMGVINSKITRYQNKNNELTTEIGRISAQIVQLNLNITNGNNIEKSGIITGKETFDYDYAEFESVQSLYDNLYETMFLNDNNNNYNKMWDDYINNSNTNHIYNIHTLCVQVQKTLLKSLNDKTNYKQISDYYGSLKELYNRIFKFTITSSIDLQQKYNNENIFLKNQLDIIKHCSQHTIFGNFYYIIMRSIIEFIKSVNPSLIKDQGMDHKLAYYSTKSYDSVLQKLMSNFKYIKGLILNELPIKTTKIILEVWDDGDDYEDPDRKYDLDKLFEKIIETLVSNTNLSITRESSLVKNLNDYIFPYFREILLKVIPEMKKILDNYNNYILLDLNNIEIIQHMANSMH